jgi:hypothetical protein
VRAWGANDYGQLGIGKPSDPAAPTTVHATVNRQPDSLTHITDIAAGGAYSVAIRQDDTQAVLLPCNRWTARSTFICTGLSELRPIYAWLDTCSTGRFPCAPFDSQPPLCNLVSCPPCLSRLDCSAVDMELLVDVGHGKLRIELVDVKGGKPVVASRLKAPIQVSNRNYTQKIQFRAQRGSEYGIRVTPGDTSDLYTPHNLSFVLRETAKRARR